MRIMTPVPNKTIYVSEEDLALYERAQELAGGNLSAAVAKALRRFVEEEGQAQQGYRPVTVRPGAGRARRAQRFTALLLGEWRHKTSERRVERFRVYRTAKGHFVLHLTKMPDWAAWSSPDAWLGDWASRFDPRTAGTGCWWGPTQESLTVADSLEELRETLPAEFFETLAEEAAGPAVEVLDI
jgi:EXLDI family protein